MVGVKISYADELRRFNLSEDSPFTELLQVLSESFGVAKQTIRLSYIDDEGDSCIIGGNEEFREAMRFFEDGLMKLRLEVVPPAASLEKSEASPCSGNLSDYIDAADGAPVRSPTHLTQSAESTSAPPAASLSQGDVLLDVLQRDDDVLQKDHKKADKAAAKEAKKAEEKLRKDAQRARKDEEKREKKEAKRTSQAAQTVGASGFSVKFVRDVTLPDGVWLPPDTRAMKTWELQNNGSVPWPSDCKLVFVKGPPGTNKLRPVPDVDAAIPPLQPGDTAQVSVLLQVPPRHVSGIFRSGFELCDGSKRRFGGDSLLYAQVQCGPQALPSASLSSPHVVPGSITPLWPSTRPSKADFIVLMRSYLLPAELGGAVDVEVRHAMVELVKANPGPAVHDTIRCDGCHRMPIVGVRYMCAVCKNVNLCEACEGAGVHPSAHAMIKTRLATGVPSSSNGCGDNGDADSQQHSSRSATGATPWRRGGMRRWGSERDRAASAQDDTASPLALASQQPIAAFPSSQSTAAQPSAATVTASGAAASKSPLWSRRKESGAGAGEVDVASGTAVKPAKSGLASRTWRAVTESLGAVADAIHSGAANSGNGAGTSNALASSAGPASQSAQSAQTSQPLPSAEFVKDANLPDGTVLMSGSSTRKMWSIRNSGQVPWPAGTSLLHVNGDIGLVPGSTPSVPLAQPGEVVQVSINALIPGKPGRYTGYYRLVAPHRGSSRRFGPRVWLDVLAVAPQVSSSGGAGESTAAVPAPSPLDAAAVSPVIPEPASLDSFPRSQHTLSSLAPTPALPVSLSLSNSIDDPAIAPTEAGAGEPQAQYASQLQLLSTLGFSDLDKMRELLVVADGDVQKVVNWLLMKPFDGRLASAP